MHTCKIVPQNAIQGESRQVQHVRISIIKHTNQINFFPMCMYQLIIYTDAADFSLHPITLVFAYGFYFYSKLHIHTRTHLNQCDPSHKPPPHSPTHTQNVLWLVVHWADCPLSPGTSAACPNIWHCVRHWLHTWLRLVFLLYLQTPVPGLFSFSALYCLLGFHETHIHCRNVTLSKIENTDAIELRHSKREKDIFFSHNRLLTADLTFPNSDKTCPRMVKVAAETKSFYSGRVTWFILSICFTAHVGREREKSTDQWRVYILYSLRLKLWHLAICQGQQHL